MFKFIEQDGYVIIKESEQIRQVRADDIMIGDDVEVWSCGNWHDADIVDGWEPDDQL